MTTALALAIASHAAARVDERAPGFNELDHTLYTAQQGAPTGVNALAQTPDGFLWIGTIEGLFRFDGSRFQRYRMPDGRALPDTDVTALLAQPTGELWAATRFGHVYAITGPGAHAYGSESGLPAHSLFGLAVDRQGRAWAGGSFGVFRLDGEQWHEVKARDGSTLHLLSEKALLADPQGRIWAVSAESGVFCLEPGATAFDKRRDASGVSGRLLAGPGGEAWISDDQGVASLTDPGRGLDARTLKRLAASGEPSPSVRHLDSQGVLWGYGNARLLRITCPSCLGDAAKAPTIQLFPRDREVSGTQFLAFLEDREGNVWVGGNGGLDRFHTSKFRQAFGDGQPLADVALSIGADGALYAGTHSTGLYRRDVSGTFVREPFGKADDNFISALYTAHDGTLWVGGDSELHKKTARGYERVPFAVSDENNYEIQAFAEDDRGGLWVSAAMSGLYRLAEGRWLRNGGVSGLPSDAPLSVRADKNTGLWLGYVDSVILNVRDGRVRRFGAEQGLAIGNVLSMLPDGSRLWVGGSSGVALISGDRAYALSAAAGESFAGVSGIVRAADGDLWLNSAEGVLRVPHAEVERFVAHLDIAIVHEIFGVHAGVTGLPENLRPLPSAIADADGGLWFATTSGLFDVDPRQIARNTVRPQVSLLGVRTEGKPHSVHADIELPAGVRALEIDYTATNLTAPELTRFRYRLDGVDASWQEAGNRRQAFYTNLSPGRYMFHVAAANEDGLWSDGDASLSVTIPAAFWQTRPFAAACIGLLLLAAWSLHRLRIGVLARRVRVRLEERLHERERIARELHDTLLQGTQGLVLGFQVAAGKLAKADPRRAEMEAILDHADQVIAEARDRVYDLRNPDGSDEDVVTALTAVGADLASSTGVHFEVSADPVLPELRDEMRGEAFLVGREALLNAFRHAGAERIRLEIRHEGRLLRMTVTDDGAGIDRDVLARGSRPGHWGLVGMRERMDRVGGRLRIQSAPQHGTTVSLEWPAGMAFPANCGNWVFRIVAGVRRWRSGGSSGQGATS
jgi:signal transduction histidine kinase/ligand-binding sensor domain-containing protein